MKPMHLAAICTACGLALLPLPSTAADDKPPVVRRPLLSASLAAQPTVAQVEIKSITLPAGVKAARHLHPCDVVGVITAGTITFQVAGEPSRQLHAGDAFHEPANATVLRFDNETGVPATFVACYLLPPNTTELIRMLP